MTTETILDEVIETLLLVILALDPAILDWLCLASAYAMKAASKPVVKRIFGALLLLVLFLLAAISIPTDPALEAKPYDLLGVTTTSSSKTITAAYNNLVHETKDSLLINALAIPKLEAYQAAHDILTDPLQRCLYHRDNKVPDWYGVPKLCWGEMLVDKLQTAKGSIRASADAKAPLKGTRAAMRKLRGLPNGAHETKSAEMTKSAKSTLLSNPTESFWARMPKPTLTSVQQSLNGTREAIITFPARMKKYLGVMFRIFQLSILVIFPAAVQRWLGRLKTTLAFVSHKTMTLFKMVSPRKPLVQLWNTVLTTLKGFFSWIKMVSPRKPLAQLWNTMLTTLKDFLSWIKMLQFLVSLPAKIREYFGWVKQAVNHVTQRTTKALKRLSPGKFWIRPFNALSTQTWQCLGWLGAMLAFVASGRHYLARLGKAIISNCKQGASYFTNSFLIDFGCWFVGGFIVVTCILGGIVTTEVLIAIIVVAAIHLLVMLTDTVWITKRRDLQAWQQVLQAMTEMERVVYGEKSMEGYDLK